MKNTINAVALVCVSTFGIYLGWQQYQKHRIEDGDQQCRYALSRIRQEIKARAAIATTELSPRGWPMTLKDEWFGTQIPHNPLSSAAVPWLEVATTDEASLTHPLMRCDMTETLSGFWYNPYLGIVRARVPFQQTEYDTVLLYNSLNDSDITALFVAAQPVSQATRDALKVGVVESATGN